MPPHRKNWWILGALIVPMFMAGLSYAYNRKTTNTMIRLLIAVVFGLLLSYTFRIAVTPAYVFSGILLNQLPIEATAYTILYKIYAIITLLIAYAISWSIIIHYWKKLPTEVKQDGW